MFLVSRSFLIFSPPAFRLRAMLPLLCGYSTVFQSPVQWLLLSRSPAFSTTLFHSYQYRYRCFECTSPITLHMTTAQNAVSNAPFNPPPSVNHFANESRIEEPTSNSIPYPSHVQIDPTPLPWRCQFTFSDGRQCRMPRHEFHVCLCKYHARREEELWGDPECSTARQLDGLFDDLSTATGINRALAQVFRMLAQKRITQREAVAFGYLAQLLLQTVR